MRQQNQKTNVQAASAKTAVAMVPAGAQQPARPTAQIGEHGLELKTFEDMYRYAAELVKAGIGQQGETASSMIAKIQTSLELGFPIMQGLKFLYVVKGKVSIEAMGKSALAVKSGLCVKPPRTWTSGQLEDQSLCGHAEVHRKGCANPVTKTFDYKRAVRAGLTGKDQSAWKNYPEDMVQKKALARALDAEFPDVCAGLSTHYEDRDGNIEEPEYTVLSDSQEPQAAAEESQTSLEKLTTALKEEAPGESSDLIEALQSIDICTSKKELRALKDGYLARLHDRLSAEEKVQVVERYKARLEEVPEEEQKA